jgi:hypothetical protein
LSGLALIHGPPISASLFFFNNKKLSGLFYFFASKKSFCFLIKMKYIEFYT